MDEDDKESFKINSFSQLQLPFVRPTAAPQKEKQQSVRLFGTNVHTDQSNSDPPDHTPQHHDHHHDHAIKINTISAASSSAISSIISATDSIRKFECHYCCRHFPTSQALGGHQNAHKRERQHAKRAHLQSVMAAAAQSQQYQYQYQYQYHHQQQLLGYPHHRIVNSPFYMASTTSTPANARFYCGPGSLAQPINRSPLVGPGPAGPWRGHMAVAPVPLPHLLRDVHVEVAVATNFTPISSCNLAPAANHLSSHNSSRGRFVRDQNNVSLDLHL